MRQSGLVLAQERAIHQLPRHSQDTPVLNSVPVQEFVNGQKVEGVAWQRRLDHVAQCQHDPRSQYQESEAIGIGGSAKGFVYIVLGDKVFLISYQGSSPAV